MRIVVRKCKKSSREAALGGFGVDQRVIGL